MWRKLTWRFFGRFSSFAVVYGIIFLIFVGDSPHKDIAVFFLLLAKVIDTLLAKKPMACEESWPDDFLGDLAHLRSLTASFFQYSWQIRVVKVLLCCSCNPLHYLKLCWPRNQLQVKLFSVTIVWENKALHEIGSVYPRKLLHYYSDSEENGTRKKI